ncbi:ladderlectin-like [Penaeus vannamei]|uniref:ladderlectin-like n=1 Tax=Penaeus vannamei TaxID=6689 RepID=UPI00387F6F44
MEGLEDLGCFYEDFSLRTWSQGRSYCQSIGGDLAVLDASADFLRVVDYYAAQTAVSSIWIGVYNTVWLSGRTPSSSEWYGSEPNGSDLCVDLRNNYGFLLGDTGCTSIKMSLCKAP